MTPVCTSCGQSVKSLDATGICTHCLFASLADDSAPGAPETAGSLWSLPGYRVEEEIARGGTAIVYRAVQLQPEREVALKVLLPTWSDARGFRERFQLEVQTLAQLDHPGILPVYEFGDRDGLPWFSMPLARGGTLASRISEYKGRWREIAALLASVAEALAHAHERGVLHRDLKPGNLLFAEDQRVFIGDFGLARVLRTPSDVTVTAAVMGTPSYLAPEVIETGAAKATTASDLWALGAILYELLAQERPFPGASIPDIVSQIVGAEPKPLAGVPRDLSAIAFHALRKNPSKRYASASAFAGDLRAWLAGEVVSARPYSAFEKTRLYLRRHPVVATLILAGVCGSVASVVVGVREAGLRRAEASARARAEVAEHEALERLRASSLAEAKAWLLTTEMGHREKALAAARRAAEIRPGVDASSAGLAALLLYDLVETRRAKTGEHRDEKLFFSDDHRIAFRLPVEEAYLEIISDWAGPNPKSVRAETETADSTIGWLYVSPSGRRAAAHFVNDVIRIWNSDTGAVLLRLPGRPFPAPSGMVGFGKDIAFSPDDETVAVGNAEGGLDLISLSDGRVLASWQSTDKVNFSAYSPDGKILAVGLGRVRNGDGLLLLDGKTLAVLSRHHVDESEPVRGLAWSRSGNTFLQASERSLHVRDGSTGNAIYAVSGVVAEIPWALSYFNDDGIIANQVAVSGRFNLVDARSGRSLLNGEFSDFLKKCPLSFSAERNEIAAPVSETEAAIFTLAKPLGLIHGKPRFSWETTSSLGSSLAWSRDGRSVTAFGVYSISVWDAEKGLPLAWKDLGTDAEWKTGVYSESGDALWLVRGQHGIFRMPVTKENNGAWSLGEPELVQEAKDVAVTSASADGRLLGLFTDATSRADSKSLLFTTRDGKLAVDTNVPFAGGTVVSPSGKRYASLVISNEGQVEKHAAAFRETGTAEPFFRLPGVATETTDGVWLSESLFCLFGADSIDGIWDVEKKIRVSTFPAELSSEVLSLSVDSTGSLLALASGTALHLLDAKTLKVLVSFPTADFGALAKVSFSPTSGKLAAVNRSNEVFIWDTTALRQALEKHHLAW